MTMEWHCLGHAMWLAEASGLRILCDPLLEDLHHSDVFEVFPGRAIDAAALRADFLLVSHRHPDHFDPKSLRRLAELDPDTVVVTPDPLVEEVARRVGFRTTRLVDPETKIDLDGPTLLTTPSVHASDPEWGIAIATEDGLVWNQIDTSLGAPADVRAFFGRAFAVLGHPRVTLALARWQPLLEIASSLAQDIGFPFHAYAAELDHLAAVDAKVACPASAGARHAPVYGAMNRLVYPVTEARFLADARARVPGTRVVPFTTGATYRVQQGEVEVAARGAVEAGLVDVGEAQVDPRDFRPLAIPEIADPWLDERDEPTLRARIERWVRGDLARALDACAPAVRVLEVVFASGTVATTFGRGPVREGVDSEWELRCAVAGSLLDDVIEGRRSWGDLLLAGMLRAASRAYTVDPHGLRQRPEQPLFVYHAISYDESVRRAVSHP